MKRRERIQKTQKAIETLYVRCEYLENQKKEAEKPVCCTSEYLEKQLAYIEGNLKCIKAELLRIEEAEIEHEMVFVEVEPGEYKLFDFMTGVMRKVPTMTINELHEYINRRAGFKIY